MTDSQSEEPTAAGPVDAKAAAAQAPEGDQTDEISEAAGREDSAQQPAESPLARLQPLAKTPSAPQGFSPVTARMATASKAVAAKAGVPTVRADGVVTHEGLELDEPVRPAAAPITPSLTLPTAVAADAPDPADAKSAAKTPDIPARPAAAPAGPAEARRSSLRRRQWAAAGAPETPGGDADPPTGGDGAGPDGSGDGPRRRGRAGLVVLGAVVLVGALVAVIASTSPGTKQQSVAVADAAKSATPSPSLQPLGASPFAVVSDVATPSPHAVKTTHKAAPHTKAPEVAHTTAKATVTKAKTATPTHAVTQQPAKSAVTTAAAAPTPPTINVLISDTDDNLVLDVDNSGTAVGTLVGTWGADNTSAQRWHLVLQPNGSYVIYSELMDLKEGLEINTNASDYSGNTITTLQDYAGDASMQWTAKYLGSNKYELVSKYNGQCLTGAGQGVANATTACNSTNAHQAWTISG